MSNEEEKQVVDRPAAVPPAWAEEVERLKREQYHSEYVRAERKGQRNRRSSR